MIKKILGGRKGRAGILTKNPNKPGNKKKIIIFGEGVGGGGGIRISS